MKKIVVLSVLGSFIVIACSKKMAPATTTTTTEKTTTEKTDVKDTASANVMNTAPNPVEGRTSESLIASGEAVFKAKCGKCHELKNPGAYTSDRWDGILKTMFPRAKLDGQQEHEVLAYIRANAKR